MAETEKTNQAPRRREIAPPKALQFAQIGTLLGTGNIVLVFVAILYAISNLAIGSHSGGLFAREAMMGTLLKFYLAIIAYFGLNAIVSIGVLFACSGVQQGAQSSPKRMVFFSIWMLLLQAVGVTSLTALALWWRHELSGIGSNYGGASSFISLQDLAGYGGGILGIVMALALGQSLYYIAAIRYFARRDVRDCFDPDVVVAEVIEN